MKMKDQWIIMVLTILDCYTDGLMFGIFGANQDDLFHNNHVDF